MYDDQGNLISEVDQTLRAYESAFDGHIRNQRGIACVASWPGIYARLFDQILAGGKQGSVSAAVVFLPEKTAHYGKHSSDRCYCEEMYGRTDVEWGCKWFELWRGHVRKAVALGQRLRVYYFEGRKAQGKVASWAALLGSESSGGSMSSTIRTMRSTPKLIVVAAARTSRRDRARRAGSAAYLARRVWS